MFEAALDDRDAVERAAIATERAHGPLLLVSGGDDRVWPADRMCTMIVDRMSKHGRGDGVKHLHYPNAGHMLFPYVRPSDVTFPAYPTDLGGTAADDLAAHTAAWPQVIEHLRGWCKRDAAGLWRKFVQPESVAAQDHSRNLLRPRAGRDISPAAIIRVRASASAVRPDRVAIHVISSQPRSPAPIASVPNSTFSGNAHSQPRSVSLKSWGE